MKKIMIPCLTLILFIGMSFYSRAQTSQQDTRLSMNFDHLSITGRVVDEAGKPVKDVMVEILLVPEEILKRELNTMGTKLEETLIALKRMYGKSVFARKKSDNNGNYKFSGVIKPGVYYIEVKNNKNYLPTKIKVNIDPTGEKEFKAPDMILTPRKGPVLSKKAVKKLEKARLMLKKKKVNEAIKLFKEVIKIEPEYAEAHYNIGILLRGQKKIKNALGHFEEAVKIQKDFKLALKALGETLFALKKYDKARHYYILYIKTLNEDEAFSKENIGIYKETAHCYFVLKDIKNAQQYMLKYVKAKEKNNLVSKDDAKIYNTIGNWFYSQKQPVKSIYFYKEAIRLNPDIDSNTYMYLGNAYYFKKEFRNSIEAFEQYIKRYPKGKFVDQVKKFKEKIERSLPKEEKK